MSPSKANLGLHVRVASREASCEKASTASFPHVPYISGTRKTHNQSSSLHFASLALCFLPSVARAACRHSRFHKDMCVKRRGYRNIKGSCLACCPVSQQKVSRTGVAMIGCEAIASLQLDAKMGAALWHVSARKYCYYFNVQKILFIQ